MADGNGNIGGEVDENNEQSRDGEVLCTLYTGTACHLCELAREVLDSIIDPGAYQVVNITGNEALTEIYGLRIPVVKTASGQEKSWPFTAGQIRKMLPKWVG